MEIDKNVKYEGIEIVIGHFGNITLLRCLIKGVVSRYEIEEKRDNFKYRFAYKSLNEALEKFDELVLENS
jgi:heme oxygenase